jgi:hypothetical protein
MAETAEEIAERENYYRHLAAEIAAMLPYDNGEARHILALVAEILDLPDRLQDLPPPAPPVT